LVKGRFAYYLNSCEYVCIRSDDIDAIKVKKKNFQSADF